MVLNNIYFANTKIYNVCEPDKLGIKFNRILIIPL